MKPRPLARFLLALPLVLPAACAARERASEPAPSVHGFHSYQALQDAVWAALERHGVFEQDLLALADFEGERRGSSAEGWRGEMSIGLWLDDGAALHAQEALAELLGELRALGQLHALGSEPLGDGRTGTVQRFELMAGLDPQQGSS